LIQKLITTAFALSLLILLASPGFGFAQKASQSPQGSGGPATGPSGGEQTPPSGGITSGNAPIESTIFSYLALDQDATKIADAVKKRTLPSTGAAGKPIIRPLIVTTQADLTTILQWRTVMTQANSIDTRLKNAVAAAQAARTPSGHDIDNLQPTDLINSNCKAPPQAQAPQPAVPGQLPGPPGQRVGAAAGAPTSASGPVWPAELQAVSAALASVAGFSQSITSSSGNMTDLPLINAVSSKLDGSIFIPSLLPPNVLNASGLGAGPLKTVLDDLEAQRQTAIELSERLAPDLSDWTTAAANANCGVRPDQAQNYLAAAQSNVAQWKPIFDILNASISSVDGFETSLFAAQNAPYQPASAAAPSQPSPSTNGPGGNTSNGAPTGPGGGNPNTQGTPNQSAQPGSVVLQILPADLLFSALGGKAKIVHFLEVHALESGGSLLTKTTSIFGNSFTSLHFSGGAMATFTLFASDGTRECSGYAASYVGFVKPGDVVSVLRDDSDEEKKTLKKALATRLVSDCQ